MSETIHDDRRPVGYREAQAAQHKLVEGRRKGLLPDLLWLLEHPPTITWGASGGQHHLREREETLRSRGIALCESERGGDVTYHEPGQIVGYPIVDLGGGGDRDLHAYLRRLEAGLIDYLGTLGIRARRIRGRTGVWIDGEPPRKIAAMGVRVRRWIASHGFALNVENPLGGFDLIVPCGIEGAAVTSLARELRGGGPPWLEVCAGLYGALQTALDRELRLVLGPDGVALAEGRLTDGPGTPGGA